MGKLYSEAVFVSTYKVSMLLRANPKMSVAPLAQVAKFLHFRVIVLDIVLDWQSSGVIHPDVTPKSK